MFDRIVAFVNHPLAPWMLAALIPCWTLLVWWNIRQQLLAPLQRQLLTARQLLDETPTSPTEFCHLFQRLDQRLRALPMVAKSWRACVDALIPAENPQPHILQLKRSSHFFRFDTLIADHPWAHRLHALPMQLVGLGVIFTFAGLLGALHEAMRTFDGSDPEQLKLALRGVVATTALKFLASIAALLSVALLHGMTSLWRQQIERECSILTAQLDARLIFVTPERLLRTSSARENQESLLETLREENRKLLTLLDNRLPHPHKPNAELRTLNSLIREEGQRLADHLETLTQTLQTSRQPADPPLALPMPMPVTTEENPELRLAWLHQLRTEAGLWARELAQHLAREIQTVATRSGEMVAARPGETGPLLTRSEQESWMRIIDRMEMAAHALEKQSENLNGLSLLAVETRRASEGSIRAGREAVETLVTSVENFNTRMEGTFSRSAETLLNRLAQNNQQVVSQVIAGLDRERAATLLTPLEPETPTTGLPNLFHQFMQTRTPLKKRRKY